MALFIQQTVAAKQAITAQATTQIKQTKLINSIVTVSALIGMLSLSACQTAPTVMKTSPVQTLPSVTKQPSTATQAPIVKNSTHATSPYESNDYEDEAYEYPIEPYTPPEQPTATNPLTEATPVYTPSTQSPIITQPDSPDSPDAIILTPSREDYMISEPSIPSHNELLERARQNSQQRSQQSTTNNSNLPAFRNLMQVGTGQLKAGNLNGAESSFTRAQRLAPKSSAVYFYLGQVALKKNQPRKAEAMARRGLTVSQDSSRRRALWQIILQSGQAQGNARVIKEAKQALR
ncbi:MULTISPECIES: tetratricopeptide repeat protein [Psychrobacter]|uniref:tetratricopeptide repeat protein n=1 Tax=Psychrobacter maritimus TaxID=256325 RepID=UPI001917F06D|nr:MULTISPECIES: tetratricopeptide repeat protein [Psychrobacter]WGV13675.1 tetratricopeptide repeat protein [Psychrobacter sp. WB2]